MENSNNKTEQQLMHWCYDNRIAEPEFVLAVTKLHNCKSAVKKKWMALHIGATDALK